MPSGSRWVPPAIEVAWTDNAAVPVRRPTRSGGGGRVERCETWLTAPLPPTRRRMPVAEAVFADAKAYLSSREAQQMSESELERELHRTGPGVDAQAPARTPRSTHPGGGPPVRWSGSTMSSARSGVCRNATRRRHPRGRVRLQAVPVFHRHRRHRRGVRYLVRDRDGVHWCTLVLPSTAVSSMRGSGSAGWPTWLEPRPF